jgi:hypothetical protein
MLKEKMKGAATALDHAAREDRLLTELGLAVIEAREANMEKLVQTSLFLRLAVEGKDSACTEIAERASHAEVVRVQKIAAVYTLFARLWGSEAMKGLRA